MSNMTIAFILMSPLAYCAALAHEFKKLRQANVKMTKATDRDCFIAAFVWLSAFWSIYFLINSK